MLRNVNFLIIAAVVALFLFLVMTYNARQTVQDMPANNTPQVYDLGMYDFDNSNAFGTTDEEDRRWENSSVRKEFNKNPFPLAEGCTNCPKKGVPNPAPGDTHVCKCGPPSKRMIDAMGGNHMIPHMCAPCSGKCDEPSQLGRWWCKKGCSQPESVGLDLRPLCSRCGN
jgi:hypothetical protein